jgi:hemerythrin-like metal-binding protein
MPIVWKSELATGNQVIDDEHKLLVCLINSVEIALKAENHANMILFLIRELHTYTLNHFAQEEKIMIERSYGGFEEHKRSHQQILREISELETSLKTAISNEENFDATEMDLVKLLRSWIVDHVIHMDLKMKPMFQKP